VAVCRTLLSSLYRPTEADGRSVVALQPADKLRAFLLRRFGVIEFSRLHGAIRALLMTSHAGDVARQRRLDSILSSNEIASVNFPLFFQLVQLEIIASRD